MTTPATKPSILDRLPWRQKAAIPVAVEETPKTRSELIAELTALREEERDEIARLQQAADDARAAWEAKRPELDGLALASNQAIGAVSSARHSYDVRRGKLERSIRPTANPAIDELIEEIRSRLRAGKFVPNASTVNAALEALKLVDLTEEQLTEKLTAIYRTIEPEEGAQS